MASELQPAVKQVDLRALRTVLDKIHAMSGEALALSRNEDLHGFADEVEAMMDCCPGLLIAFRDFLLDWNPLIARRSEPDMNQGESL
jgi:hypothetical protein